MNPQYMPQQGVPPQTFPQNRPSPTITQPTGFQNVPLASQKPMFQANGPMPSNFGVSPANCPPNMNMPYATNILPQNTGPLPASNVRPTLANMPPPTNVGPPPTSVGTPLTNMVHPPSTNMNHLPPSMGFPPTTNMGPPTTTYMGPTPVTNVGPPPTTNMGPPSTTNIGPPPTTNMAPSLVTNMGGALTSMGPPSSTNTVKPLPPGNLGSLPTAASKLNVQNPRNVDKSVGNPSLDTQSNQEPSQTQHTAQVGHPPQTILTNQLPPTQANQKSLNQQISGSPVSQDNLIEPPMSNGSFNITPPTINGANQQPQLKQQYPPMPGSQYPQAGMMNQSVPGRPPLNILPPHQQIQTSQFNQSSIPGQIPISGPTPNPMFITAQNAPQMHPPGMGQTPMFKQPASFPGPNMPTQGQQLQFNPPPLLAQNPNQLSNQMQGMSLSGPRQYPGIQQKPPGDNLTSPQGYLNNQQMRMQQGYPPSLGQAPMQQQQGSFQQQPYQQPQRRLDPDQMPNPIQVTQDDQSTRCGVFCTNQKGLVPPLVTTKFVVQDQGNASPRYIRSSMYNVPISQDLMKQTAVPFGLVISPMARTVESEHPPPIINFGTLGPVRCIRCKAYMAPFMQFIDSGRRFQCLFCKASTDVPNEYFQHLDHTGQRMDKYERPELVLGTYEMVATADYCRNVTLPKPPAIIFVIDVSYNTIKSGLVNLLCSQMKEVIQNLPVDQGQEKSNMRVGFITYNSTVHFYNIKGTLAAPQMLVVGDTQEMFMPLLDGFLCTPEESSAVIDQLMEQIPTMFSNTRETETVLLPAILAGLEALKASDCAGKLMIFHSTLPIAEAPGKLKNRDDRKLLGTDKERTVLTPQIQAYNQLGQDCVGAGCSVDLFIFNNAYIDIATIGQVARLTGGEVYKYTYFQADLDGERLINDIIANISRPIAFDAIMRVRTSTGVRPTDFYGHFFMSNTTDMELGSIDCDKAIAVEIKHDDKLNEDEGVYVQVALLYTSCSGQRRLRIINLSLKTCSQMTDLYRSCDLDTIINFFGKQAVYKLLDNNPKAVKDAIVNRAAQMLANYRKNCASPSSAGQLILPECMKLLPLYVNCLLKSDALSGGSDITLDDRSYVMQRVMTMDVLTSVSYFYPRLIPLHDIKPEADGKIEMPAPIRCTIEKMHDQGVYILENGIHMFLWIGLGAGQEFIQQVFGVPSAIQIDIDKLCIPELNTPLSIAVRSIIDEIRLQKQRCMRLTLVRQREKLEPVFKHFLVEDRGQDGSPSYVDFLCHMHKEIRTILS